MEATSQNLSTLHDLVSSELSARRLERQGLEAVSEAPNADALEPVLEEEARSGARGSCDTRTTREGSARSGLEPRSALVLVKRRLCVGFLTTRRGLAAGRQQPRKVHFRLSKAWRGLPRDAANLVIRSYVRCDALRFDAVSRQP